MHSCPDCDQACACDGEDVWNDEAAEECVHNCDTDGEQGLEDTFYDD